ncbi:MAG: hypothetical protein JWO56_736, partial [Acidobacteria bacterium]|nr:hypothetical protein [Acidobacteriota bacterium]
MTLVIAFTGGDAVANVPPSFIRVTMSTLGSVKNLRRGSDGKVHVAVLARAASLPAAQALAGQLELDGSAQPMGLKAVVAQVNGSNADAARLADLHRTTPLAALILFDPPPASMSGIMSFASQRQVLTISSRPRDTALAGLVIVDGVVYRYDRQLNAEKVIVDNNLRSVAVEGQPFGVPYEKARDAMDRRATNWGPLAVQLRMAINASGDVPPRIVPRPGGQSEPYLPHLHLARMLFKLGDCEGAEEELAFSL